MFSSEQVWGAVDRLASRNGLSPSRLSIKAGLDPTALNKSKRSGAGGRPRWMSTETIAKILTATRTPPQEFFEMICGPSHKPDGEKPAALPKPGWSGERGHVLLVDPDQLFTKRMATELAAAGYEVEVVPDLRRALDVIEGGALLNMLVTNLALPYGVQGRILAQIARTYRPGLKIIFVADSLPAAREANGDETILPRDLLPGQLGAAVSRMLPDGGKVPAGIPMAQPESQTHRANGSGSASD